MKTTYYQEINMNYINKVQKAIEARLTNNSVWLTLKNGVKLGIHKAQNGDVRVYDDDANLVAEFSNTGANEYCNGYAMFNTAVFVIRANYKKA